MYVQSLFTSLRLSALFTSIRFPSKVTVVRLLVSVYQPYLLESGYPDTKSDNASVCTDNNTVCVIH